MDLVKDLKKRAKWLHICLPFLLQYEDHWQDFYLDWNAKCSDFHRSDFLRSTNRLSQNGYRHLSVCGDADQLRKISDMYAQEIADLSAENEALKAKTSQLEADNQKLAKEWEQVLEMLVEAKQIIEMAEV